MAREPHPGRTPQTAPSSASPRTARGTRVEANGPELHLWPLRHTLPPWHRPRRPCALTIAASLPLGQPTAPSTSLSSTRTLSLATPGCELRSFKLGPLLQANSMSSKQCDIEVQKQVPLLGKRQRQLPERRPTPPSKPPTSHTWEATPSVPLGTPPRHRRSPQGAPTTPSQSQRRAARWRRCPSPSPAPSPRFQRSVRTCPVRSRLGA